VNAEIVAEMPVEPGDELVDFVTGPGDVVIRGWDAGGREVAVRAAIEVDEGQHEVWLTPGLAVRLTAEPALDAEDAAAAADPQP
jgi:hypothetical protein